MIYSLFLLITTVTFKGTGVRKFTKFVANHIVQTKTGMNLFPSYE